MQISLLNRIVLYAHDVDAVIRFYVRHFGFEVRETAHDRIIELVHPDGGAILMVHRAAKGQKAGQSSVKLVFDVADVQAFCERSDRDGLHFGALHKADGYCFANVRDPSGNSVSVSSRAFRKIT